jgi:hypothetical protein
MSILSELVQLAIEITVLCLAVAGDGSAERDLIGLASTPSKPE